VFDYSSSGSDQSDEEAKKKARKQSEVFFPADYKKKDREMKLLTVSGSAIKPEPKVTTIVCSCKLFVPTFTFS